MKYEKTIIDEVSGVEVPNELYKAYMVGIEEAAEFISMLIIGVEGVEFEERFDGDKGCLLLDMNENQWKAKQKDWGL